MNIIILPDGSKWYDDIAFGGDGPTMALPLVDDGRAHQNLGAQQVRLIKDWIPTQVHRTEATKLWIYQYRNGDERSKLPWNSFYAFVELEFMLADWDVVNWWTGSHPDSRHVKAPLVVKFLSRPHQNEPTENADILCPSIEIYGKRMLIGAMVKENLGGRTRTIQEYTTEKSRTEGLEHQFDIRLSDEEKAHIQGWPSSLAAT